MHHLEEEKGTPSDSGEGEDTVISQVKNRGERSPPIVVRVCVNGVELDDTGASVSLMGEVNYSKLFPECPLGPSEVRLQTYLGEAIPVVGSVVVHVEYEGQQVDLPLTVTKGNGLTLLGRTWLREIRLNWQSIYHASQPELSKVLDQYTEVFEDGLGTFKDYEAHLEVDPDAQPRSKISPLCHEKGRRRRT